LVRPVLVPADTVRLTGVACQD